MKKGDIVLLPFPFTDLSGSKTRPALVLCSDDYDTTVAFITSKLIKQDLHDVEIAPSFINGLKVDSIIKLKKIATLDKKLMLGKLGELEQLDLASVDQSLVAVFDIKVNFNR